MSRLARAMFDFACFLGSLTLLMLALIGAVVVGSIAIVFISG